MNRINLFILGFFVLSILACGGGRASVAADKSKLTTNLNSKTQIQENVLSIKSSNSYIQGDDIVFSLKNAEHFDSLHFFLRNIRVNAVKKGENWSIKTDNNSRLGSNSLKVIGFKEGTGYSAYKSFKLTSNKKPDLYRAVVAKTFPHDKYSYTQGLEFHNGMLYESSGEYGKSFIRILEFPSMKLKKHTNLDKKYFAEGMTIIDDKLFMLTWQEFKCFVYDTNNLKVTKEFQYNTEGWGLANDGKYLYMSDGSHYIYILDPATFRQIDRLEILLDGKQVTNINELEWIEGEIWANVYTTDEIIRINPKSGAINGIIDASNLLNKSDYSSSTDVLNGIAYDKATKKIYLTGKNWPKLFEVTINKL